MPVVRILTTELSTNCLKDCYNFEYKWFTEAKVSFK